MNRGRGGAEKCAQINKLRKTAYGLSDMTQYSSFAFDLEQPIILDRTCVLTQFPILAMVFPHAAMEGLAGALWTRRQSLPVTEWREYCAGFPHRFGSVHHLLQQDVFTRHSYQRPRGYPGDADLIDIIYDKNPAGSIDIGRRIFSYTIHTEAAEAVRERRQIAATYIEDAIAGRPGARICSIACGHARELDGLTTGGETEPFVFEAHDQDRRSLDRIIQIHGSKWIQPKQQSVLDWIKGKSKRSKFDLIYSLGLLDYLEERIARALVGAAWHSIAPGGTLLLANFSGDFADIAYMEACMNWWLIYRNEADMEALLADLPAETIADTRLFKDSLSRVIYLEISKQDTCEV